MRDSIGPGRAISAAEVAGVLAREVEGSDVGPLTLAAEEFARAARQPRGARPAMERRVHDLRHVASDLSLLGRIAPGETGQVLLIVADLIRIASTLTRAGSTKMHDPRVRASRRAVAHYSAFVGTVSEAQVVQVRAALREPTASIVLADPAWPALAAQMRRLEASGVDPGRALNTALRSRETSSARSVAQILHHRLTQSSPRLCPPFHPKG